MIVLTEDEALAHLELGYFDDDSDVYELLSELYHEHHGIYAHPRFDLLNWFKIKFHWIDGEWVHINNILKQ